VTFPQKKIENVLKCVSIHPIVVRMNARVMCQKTRVKMVVKNWKMIVNGHQEVCPMETRGEKERKKWLEKVQKNSEWNGFENVSLVSALVCQHE